MRSSGWTFILIVVLVFLPGTLTSPSFTALAQEGSVLPHINAEDLKKLIETKADIVIVDVQPKGAYEIGHIKGAINLPWAKEIKGPVKLPKNKLLVIYCDCTHEEDSTDLATQLIEKFSYKSDNIKVLTGGWSGWLKLGYPTEKGKSKGK